MTTAVTTYSSTEKKRIRKSFAKRASVLNVPFLLATQLESYTAFLQAAVAGEKRKNEGLQAAFTSLPEWLEIGKIEVNAACKPSFLRFSPATAA